MTTVTGFGTLGYTQDDRSQIEFLARQMMNGMAVATLVKVAAVNDTTVDVIPMVHQIDGAGKPIEHGLIHDMPFHTMRSGASSVVLKPSVGDIGLAVFCHSDIAAVKRTKAPAPPGTRRRFDWADGLYLGGFLGATPTQLISIDDAAGITIQSAAGKPVTITAPGGLTINGDVHVTGTLTADTDVVGGGKHLKTHTHGGVQTGSGTSGAPT